MIRALILCASIAAPCAFAADQVTLIASNDTTLFESELGELANGSGEHSYAGLTFGAGLRRALYRFDVAAGVPAGSRIVDVQLVLRVSRSFAGEDSVNLHRVLASWGEGASDAGTPGGQGAASQPGDATWLHRRYPDQFWATPGGEFDPVASGSTLVDFAGEYTWASTPRLVADVQSWIDDPTSNFGWLIESPSSGSRSARRFETRESTVASWRPKLIVRFELACAADFNQDGGVDGSDIDAFFAAWEAGSNAADVNQDGGIDGADVGAFFEVWEAGGC